MLCPGRREHTATFAGNPFCPGALREHTCGLEWIPLYKAQSGFLYTKFHSALSTRA